MRVAAAPNCSGSFRLLSPLVLLLLAGCGYPGDPRPPALNRPVPVSDLTAVQHGGKILVQFTVPTDTTEDLPLRTPPEIELRIGPPPPGKFDFPAWEKTSERIAVPSGGNIVIDAAKYTGKSEIIGLKAHGPHGQDAGWSHLELLSIVQALPKPEGLQTKDAADAVRLDWHAAAPQFRIFRDGIQIGTSDKPFFSDAEIEYGKTYQYSVQSIEKAGDKYAESDLSAPVTFKPTDRFAPATPTGLSVVPGTRTIELVWDRNAEKDFAGYRVYRDGVRITDALTAPAFSDKDVKSGVRYSYQVTAVDAVGNESPKSPATEALIP